MTSSWSEYLLTQGASLADGVVAHFGDAAGELAAARDGLILADLSDWGLIAFSGEEAQTFLHGQVTNDLRGLTPEQAVFAAYCSAKGRMQANFLALRRDADILLMLPESLREGVQKRISMFILRAKVKARDAGGEWRRLGLSGEGAEALLGEALGVLPAAAMLAVAHADSGFAVRLGEQRFDILVKPEAAAALWEKLAGRARPVGKPAWDWLLVRAGVPTILPETKEEFVPQMANMDVLHGVSFNKGCYPGQEIVARTQYLGKLKKRLYLAHVDVTAQPGENLYSPAFGEQSAGLVANAAAAPEGGTDVLVVLQTAAFDNGEVRLGALAGPAVSFSPLPYSLP